MEYSIYVPESLCLAGRQIRCAMARRLDQLAKPEFVRAWCSLAYLFPGLNPDGFDSADCGWPPTLKPFANEAWRRFQNGELADVELYPSDAQWSGLYDRMTNHTAEETARRLELSAAFGRCTGS